MTSRALTLLAMAAGAASSRLGAKWRPEQCAALADAALLDDADDEVGPRCDLAVVGTGWAGAYFAWRLGVDAAAVDAARICVFEANGRVGGRIFSARDLPTLEGLALDVGGYRFIEVDALPADLVRARLEMPTSCYDYNCTKECPGEAEAGGAGGFHTCYVLRDAYGNNAGYAQPIELMLDQLIDASARVRFGARLTGVFAGEDGATTLAFADGVPNASAARVLLNLPSNAIGRLDGVLAAGAGAPAARAALVDDVWMPNITKVYASYGDAWWATKLGRMEGTFERGLDDPNATAPLQGRYHDGPLKCVVGADPSGAPVYSGEKLPFGNCSGAIEVFYTRAHPYYQRFESGVAEQPLAVFDLTAEGGASADAVELARAVHASLMDFHRDALAAAGVDADRDVPPPRMITVSNWRSGDTFTPSCGNFTGDAAAAALARRPLPESMPQLFVANTDIGPQFCWATGALIVAEKILQAELGVAAPSWLNATWYEQRVVAQP